MLCCKSSVRHWPTIKTVEALATKLPSSDTRNILVKIDGRYRWLFEILLLKNRNVKLFVGTKLSWIENS